MTDMAEKKAGETGGRPSATTLEPGDRLLKLADVSRKVALGRSAIYERIRTERFPRPRSVGPKCSRWLASEIEAWMRNLPETPIDDAA